jgi:hypothetical protein
VAVETCAIPRFRVLTTPVLLRSDDGLQTSSCKAIVYNSPHRMKSSNGVLLPSSRALAAARFWDCCHFGEPHRGGPERPLPNVWNNEKVFPVF